MDKFIIFIEAGARLGYSVDHHSLQKVMAAEHLQKLWEDGDTSDQWTDLLLYLSQLEAYLKDHSDPNLSAVFETFVLKVKWGMEWSDDLYDMLEALHLAYLLSALCHLPQPSKVLQRILGVKTVIWSLSTDFKVFKRKDPPMEVSATPSQRADMDGMRGSRRSMNPRGVPYGYGPVRKARQKPRANTDGMRGSRRSTNLQGLPYGPVRKSKKRRAKPYIKV